MQQSVAPPACLLVCPSPLSLALFVSLLFTLFVSLCLSLSLCVSLCLSLSLFVSLCLSLPLFVSLRPSPPPCLPPSHPIALSPDLLSVSLCSHSFPPSSLPISAPRPPPRLHLAKLLHSRCPAIRAVASLPGWISGPPITSNHRPPVTPCGTPTTPMIFLHPPLDTPWPHIQGGRLEPQPSFIIDCNLDSKLLKG